MKESNEVHSMMRQPTSSIKEEKKKKKNQQAIWIVHKPLCTEINNQTP
jgi:hypothetical protein